MVSLAAVPPGTDRTSRRDNSADRLITDYIYMTGATFRTGYHCCHGGDIQACMDLPLKKVDTSALCLMRIRPSTVKTVVVKSVLRISR